MIAVCVLGLMCLRLMSGCDSSKQFLEFDYVYSSNSTATYEAVVFFLNGYQSRAMDQWNTLASMGFQDGLSERVKFVVPVIKRTSKNKSPGWFPFAVLPWDNEDGTRNLAYETDLVASAEVIMPLIDREAKLLDGRYDKIFLFGYSQGGMISHWLSLNAEITLGGVINYQGCFPMSTSIRNFPPQGSIVPLIHMHDPNDPVVPLKYVQAGREAALSAGASAYPPIISVTSEGHHGITRGSVTDVRDWILANIENVSS